MAFYCSQCDADFESEETQPRCPTCMRRSSVEGAPTGSEASSGPPRLSVTLGLAFLLLAMIAGVVVGIVSLTQDDPPQDVPPELSRQKQAGDDVLAADPSQSLDVTSAAAVRPTLRLETEPVTVKLEHVQATLQKPKAWRINVDPTTRLADPSYSLIPDDPNARIRVTLTTTCQGECSSDAIPGNIVGIGAAKVREGLYRDGFDPSGAQDSGWFTVYHTHKDWDRAISCSVTSVGPDSLELAKSLVAICEALVVED